MTKPKILLFDIETSPDLSYVWGRWQQDVIAVKEDWQILSFSYKWLGDRTVTCQTRRWQSEKQLLEALWKLLDEAEVTIAHNGDEFDHKKASARFLIHGMKPPSPYQSIDTKKIAKRYFKFNSNSLDDLGRTLGVGRKLKHSGFDLWLGCMAGDKKSWDKMARYNKQDVALLERVYKKLLPWINNHPNIAQIMGKESGCPKCGSLRLVKNGIKRNKTGEWTQYLCRGCGGYCRNSKSDKLGKRQKVVNL
jgi:DNA polymerase elongation subunit (family B)